MIISKTREWICWTSMKQRCRNPNSTGYALYGARGIQVCERWNKFANFLADMGEAPDGMTIERIDNNGHYEPNNCRWATLTEQNRNQRTNRLITIDGETLCVTAWAERFGIDPFRIYQRLDDGWPPEKAVKTGVRNWHLRA